MRTIEFVLFEMLQTEKLLESERFSEHDREGLKMVLETAYDLAREVVWPTYQQSDAEAVGFDGEHATAPPCLHEVWSTLKEGGWFASMAPYEFDGMQLPHVVGAALSYIFNAANTSLQMYVGSAAGAALLINNHGTQELKDQYLPKLFSGEWGGTMCLSEPDAGSSLGDLTTTAVKAKDGDYYHIKGVKRWISSGDHDLTDNIVHPVLARVEGAPAGSKGISLFLVPKYRLNADGGTGEFNDVQTAGVEHKLGLRAQATATLNFGDNDDCQGWLLGEENRGLIHMFDLVNNARIHVGLQAAAQGSAAYHIALQYSRERLQGRKFTNPDPTTDPVAIIEHADVRQMLLQQKAYSEGIFALLAYCAILDDQTVTATSPEEVERAENLLGVLTPVGKAYGSDISFETIRLAIQTLGGAGFTEDFPLAQMLRDCKVHSIYEGTNGIQGQDLLGRRIVKNQGAALRAAMEEMSNDVAASSAYEDIKGLGERVAEMQEKVGALTMHLGQIGMGGDVELYMANATLYLRIFSELVIAWQLLRQATVAQRALADGSDETAFYKGKIESARFYIQNVFPHTNANIELLMNNERLALDFDQSWFDGGVEEPATV